METEKNLVYLDTYVLQQDMRIRMPKTILANMKVEKGKTRFSIFLDKEHNTLILKIADSEGSNL